MKNPLLPDSILDRCQELPDKPDPICLMGKYIRLEPLVVERDAKTLFEVSNGSPITMGKRYVEPYDSDQLIWRHMFEGPFKHFEDFKQYLLTYKALTHGCCHCVFDQGTGKQIGVINYLNNVRSHLKIELGGIWYSPVAQKTLANTEATYLMLDHAFSLGYRRLEWKCDVLNERSQKAALRLGFKFEGIQEKHFIVKGRSRDTAWFRMLDSEWPEQKKRLQVLLA